MLAAWPQQPPGVPSNMTVAVGEHSALIRWSHAPPSKGGLASNFAVLWQQEAATEEALWSADIDVAASHFALGGLTSGRRYGFRIAAYNMHGQVRSDIQRFSTLSTLT